MLSRAASLLAIVFVASTLVAADASGAPATEGERSTTAPPAEGPTRATGAPAGESRKKKDPDQELIDHLEQIERLELLQNLELFDSEAPKKK